MYYIFIFVLGLNITSVVDYSAVLSGTMLSVRKNRRGKRPKHLKHRRLKRYRKNKRFDKRTKSIGFHKKRMIKGKVKRHSKGLRLVASYPKRRKIKYGLRGDKRKIKFKVSSKRTDKYPPIPVYHIHMKLLKTIRVYDSRGNIRRSALNDFNKLVRCYHTNKVLEMDYRLLIELYAAWMYFGMPQVTIYSGCRQPPYANKTSKHVHGEALDFNLDGISRRALVRYFLKRTLKLRDYKLGIGFYPNSYHIHMDIRKQKGFWVDLGGPGEKARYVESPYAWFFRKETFNKNKKSSIYSISKLNKRK